MLSQLNIFAKHSDKSRSARQTKTRVRPKFDYHISIDRPVCKEVFLFYYGLSVISFSGKSFGITHRPYFLDPENQLIKRKYFVVIKF